MMETHWALRGLTEEQREHDQLITKMGISIERLSPTTVTGRMPVAGNRQPFGALHGGANAVLAETLGSLAAYSLVGEGGQAMGIELSCSHHRWAREGEITGYCNLLAEGQSLATYEIKIFDSHEQLTCSARLTVAIRKSPRRSNGYQ